MRAANHGQVGDHGQLECIRLLIERGASMDIQSTKGSTALLIACKAKKWSVCRLLVESGASVVMQDNAGCTPFMLAAKEGGGMATVKLLVDRGADVNLPDRTGLKVLMYACRRRDVESARSLLDCGAKIAVGTNSTFFEACSAGSKDLIELLLERGAAIDARDENGKTGLMLACGGTNSGPKKVEVAASVQALLDHKAAMNLQAADGSTALMLASLDLRGKNLAQLLLRAGADANLQRKDGKSALMLLCVEHRERSRIRDIELLIRHGAELGVRDRWGWSALEFACDGPKRGASLRNRPKLAAEMDLVILLVNAGAPLDFSHIPSEDARAALTIACQHGFLEVLQLLRKPSRPFSCKQPPRRSGAPSQTARSGKRSKERPRKSPEKRVANRARKRAKKGRQELK